MLELTFILILLGLFLIWLVSFFFFHDWTIPHHKKIQFKNILIIFPHPDDEVIGTGGLIHLLSQKKCCVTVVLLTKGERGTGDLSKSLALKKIRELESLKVQEILGITKLIHKDLGDEMLSTKRVNVSKFTKNLVNKLKPDLVVTYDLAGLYGHPDHMLVSDVITKLIKKNFMTTPLWYVSFPHKIMKRIKIPAHHQKDLRYVEKRSQPTHKIFLGMSILKKIQAMVAYKSQRHSFQKAMPIRFVPFEFFYSLQLYEYYAEAVS